MYLCLLRLYSSTFSSISVVFTYLYLCMYLCVFTCIPGVYLHVFGQYSVCILGTLARSRARTRMHVFKCIQVYSYCIQCILSK